MQRGLETPCAAVHHDVGGASDESELRAFLWDEPVNDLHGCLLSNSGSVPALLVITVVRLLLTRGPAAVAGAVIPKRILAIKRQVITIPVRESPLFEGLVVQPVKSDRNTSRIMRMVTAPLVHVYPDIMKPGSAFAVLGVPHDDGFGKQASARKRMPASHLLASSNRLLAASALAEPPGLAVGSSSRTTDRSQATESLAGHVLDIKASWTVMNTFWHGSPLLKAPP